MIFRKLHLPENAAKLAQRLNLSKNASKNLVKFALTIEHSGGLAVGLEFISRATFHFPPSFLAWIVVGFGLLIWHYADGE